MGITSPIRTYQWVLILGAAALFALWELTDHLWLMQAPMRLQHGLNLGVTTLLLAATASAVFAVLRRYEQAWRHLNTRLQIANEALQRLEATRDERLVEIAKELSLTQSSLVAQAQMALQSTTDLPNIKAFSAAIDRAEHSQGLVRASDGGREE